jgi:hypothetical protein
MKVKLVTIGVLLLLTVFFSSCRKEIGVIPWDQEQLPAQPATLINGFYLLNEGNMNMNRASLDHYDFETGVYRRNMYEQINPSATKGLGDVGNDLGIYGSKLYAVISCSNKVEIMDVATGGRLKVIEAKNCRYVTFSGGHAYVSVYDGDVGVPGVNGYVIEIDTVTLNITRKVEVGRQPEEMAVVGNQLYVANSGGYSPPNYEHTLSVIDLTSFTKINDIDIAPNLHRVKADKYGNIYVTSRGDNLLIPSRLYVVDTQTGKLKNTYNIAISNLCIAGDTVYAIAGKTVYNSAQNAKYYMIDILTETILPESFIRDGSEEGIRTPYGIAVDPVARNIYLTDATDYVSPGVLYCFNKNGIKQFTVMTGDIPAHIAFVYK